MLKIRLHVIMNPLKPNFLIIGAQKSGTTSLADCLGKHSQVFVCEPREPEYFSSKNFDESSWLEYLSLFDGSKDHKVRGEASTCTMLDKSSIELIEKRVPDVKVIAVL